MHFRLKINYTSLWIFVMEVNYFTILEKTSNFLKKVVICIFNALESAWSVAREGDVFPFSILESMPLERPARLDSSAMVSPIFFRQVLISWPMDRSIVWSVASFLLISDQTLFFVHPFFCLPWPYVVLLFLTVLNLPWNNCFDNLQGVCCLPIKLCITDF